MIRLLPCIYLLGGRAVASPQRRDESLGDAVALGRAAGEAGASALLVVDLSEGDEEHEASILTLREICKRSPRPVFAGGHMKRLEDVKKVLYAGCAGALLDLHAEQTPELCKEASLRFGKEKILASTFEPGEFLENRRLLEEYASVILLMGEAAKGAPSLQTSLKIWSYFDQAQEAIDCLALGRGGVDALVCPELVGGEINVPSFRVMALDEGIHTTCLWSELSWEELTKGPLGLIPVVVQEDATNEVLMVAYMDQEAFEHTLRTGRMTYYSRSRRELWVKGLTSGNFQYVKTLSADCDRDTLLARVEQIGAACHTGSHSCFFTTLAGQEQGEEKDASLSVLQEVYEVIQDRKENPKEGSYTNYLFDKGIDKILKKVGEEATEIVIAAKNPGKEEVKYEISDFLYHVMVLMVEKGLSWEEVAQELANR